MGKYDGWDEYFRELTGETHSLDFGQLQALIDGTLPPSAHTYDVWWVGPHYYAKWRTYGWYAHPDLKHKVVYFDRTARGRGRPVAARALPVPVSGTASSLNERRMILLGCVKTKLPHPAPAKDLYISALWQKRRAYAEASGQPWRILSAEHGLLDPDEVIPPYDRHLKSQSSAYRLEWSTKVARSILVDLQKDGLKAVELHASSAYVEGIGVPLAAAGIAVVWPFEGLRQGEHLAWYQSGRLADEAPASGRDEDLVVWEWPLLKRAERIGAFEFKWPDGVEAFDGGWEGAVEWHDRTWQFRHGVGGRVVYGRFRVHTVTWLNSAPTVEGVAADDDERSSALLSLIKAGDGSTVKTREDVPREYHRFQVVDHRSEIDAPYSRYGLAVKIRVDDVSAWVAHALLRNGGEPSAPKHLAAPHEPPDLEPDDRAEPLPITDEPRPIDEKLAIAYRLLEFAAEPAQLPAADGIPNFTPLREANELLAADPFAFLIAVIADYQIAAERAWSLPYLLRERLGHIDPVRLITEPERLAEAVARRPSLHRYINRVPEFILAACRIVLDKYDGDAGSIWTNEPKAADLQKRLREFPGISQKKAAMAVEMLERDLRVSIRELGGSDIAFDVHVRRVFLRTGLAEQDDADHMINIARRLHPERPGALDLPTWNVGRSWCHPANPDCRACVLDLVCDHRIEVGRRVRGA